MKTIDTEAYLSALRELTDTGHEVSVTIRGGSMLPFLVPQRDRILFSKPNRPLRKGDIVLYQRANGSFVAHRIRRVHGNGCCDMIGDAQTQLEYDVPPEQIFALVTGVQRKGKWLNARSFWWQFFAHVWLWIIPLRRQILRLYGTIKNI